MNVGGEMDEISILGENIVEMIHSGNWRMRKNGVVEVQSVIRTTEEISSSLVLLPTQMIPVEKSIVFHGFCDILMKLLKDRNINVFLECLSTILLLCGSVIPHRLRTTLLSSEITPIIENLTKKLGDSNERIRGETSNTLVLLSETPVLFIIFSVILKCEYSSAPLGRINVLFKILKRKSDSVRKSSTWNSCLSYAFSYLEHANSGVRTSAQTFVALLYGLDKEGVAEKCKQMKLKSSVQDSLRRLFKLVDEGQEIEMEEEWNTVVDKQEDSEEDSQSYSVNSSVVSLLVSSSNLQRKDGESNVKYLNRITHLHLNDRNLIEIIDLKCCPSLEVMYLYDNNITSIKHLDGCSQLTHLYLQRNKISRIENMNNLQTLCKLYLEMNRIERIENLSGIPLVELHIGNQTLDDDVSLSVDEDTLISLSRTLRVLNISGNNIANILPFRNLSGLTRLIATSNRLSDLLDIETFLTSLRYLTQVDFTGNPIHSMLKYRETVLVSGQSLLLLDGDEVNPQEQAIYTGIRRKRTGRRVRISTRTQQQPQSQSALSPVKGRSVLGYK